MEQGGRDERCWMRATSFQSPNPFTLWCMVSNIIFYYIFTGFFELDLIRPHFFFFFFLEWGIVYCGAGDWTRSIEHAGQTLYSWALPVSWAESSKVAPDKLSTPVVRRPLRHTETVFICGSRYPHVAGRPLKCTQTAEKWNILGNFNLNLNSPPGLAIPILNSADPLSWLTTKDGEGMSIFWPMWIWCIKFTDPHNTWDIYIPRI